MINNIKLTSNAITQGTDKSELSQSRPQKSTSPKSSVSNTTVKLSSEKKKLNDISDIKLAIANGEYKINTKSIAIKIMNNF